MFIAPIPQISNAEKLNKSNEQIPAGSLSEENPFYSMFQNAVDSVKETQSELNGEIVKLATGQTDDLHTAMIASQKASLSVELLVQLRNQTLEAYREIMNMGI